MTRLEEIRNETRFGGEAKSLQNLSYLLELVEKRTLALNAAIVMLEFKKVDCTVLKKALAKEIGE